MTPNSFLRYDEEKDKPEPLVPIFRGQLKKKSLHTTDFSPEMGALAYIMIFNHYPVKNLITLSQPRTIFLYDLFTHKEIDICGHIYHLLIKCVRRRKSRMTLSFPSLIISLISKARVKLPSGLPVMSKEDPISEHTINRSKAHIPSQEREVGATQVQREEAETEGGNTKDWCCRARLPG